MRNKEIASRNDQLRSKIPSIIPPNVLFLTRGVANLPIDDVSAILKMVMVKEFSQSKKKFQMFLFISSACTINWMLT